jgi:hypothetical protein
VIAAQADAHVSRNAIKLLDDGTWVLLYNKANNHTGSEWSHVNLRFSADHGRTWTKENHLLDGTPVRGVPCGNPDNLATADPWLYVAPNGDLVIHFWRVEWRTATWKGFHGAVASRARLAASPLGCIGPSWPRDPDSLTTCRRPSGSRPSH